MKKILTLVENSHLQNAPSSTLSESTNDTGKNIQSTEIISEKIIVRVWVKMIEIYGHKWDSLMGKALDEQRRLTPSAKTWKAGLDDLSPDDVAEGFRKLVKSDFIWPPSLPEFRILCKPGSSIPSVDDIVRLLVFLPKDGSLAERYQHPLALAISRKIDMFKLRTSSNSDCVKIVKPVYDQLAHQDWSTWPVNALEVLK